METTQELELQTPIVTFDQPLWIKANEIVHAKCMNIALILEGFYTMMSFPGSIGSLMSGSGLAESLEICYGKNTVKHMLIGKGIARVLLEETLMPPFLIINKNSSNTEVEGNDKAQTDRNNQNVIYDHICGEQYDEPILENEDTSWEMKLCYYMMN